MLFNGGFPCCITDLFIKLTRAEMDIAKATLTQKLGEKAATDFIKSVLALENLNDIKKRVCSILDTRRKENRQIYEILIKEKVRLGSFPLEDGYMKRNTNPNAKCTEHLQLAEGESETITDSPIDNCSTRKPTKHKPKFQPLFEEGAHAGQLVSILPGRHPCQCLATKHQLVSNCCKCGRVVCAQEGSGRCFFCGELVCTTLERDKIAAGTKQAQKLYNRLLQSPWAPGTETPRYRLGKGKSYEREVARVAKGVNEVSVDDKNNSDEEEADCVIPENVGGTGASKRLEDGLASALANRDRLLEYDATSAKRTKVLDDELDYFASAGSEAASATWLSPEVRERVIRRVAELRAQRHASRLVTSQLCFDLEARGAVFRETGDEAARQLYRPTETEMEELERGGQTGGGAPSAGKVDTDSRGGLGDPSLQFASLQFIPKEDSHSSHRLPSNVNAETGNKGQLLSALRQPESLHRLQDITSRQLVDDGYCLSMHQPWASFLIRGIKRDEGRTWYSAHRGCLWIASTAKPPDTEVVEEMEKEHLVSGGLQEDLPTSYPTGCLLGRVNVVDVLSQEDYHQKYPDGDSNSPYVFVCDDPRELLFKLPISGKHKVYRLEKEMHAAALKTLT